MQRFYTDSGLPGPLDMVLAWHDVCYILHAGEQDSPAGGLICQEVMEQAPMEVGP